MRHLHLDPAKLRRAAVMDYPPKARPVEALAYLIAVDRIFDAFLADGVRVETPEQLEAILRERPALDMLAALLPRDGDVRDDLRRVRAAHEEAIAALRKMQREAEIPYLARALFRAYGADGPLPPLVVRDWSSMSITRMRAEEDAARMAE